MYRVLTILAVLSLAVLLLFSPAHGGEITVSAAVSLKEALSDIAGAYVKQGGGKVHFNFGATGHLLAQIRLGAPVDGFVSAAESHMDQAVTDRLVDASSRTVIAGNALVLIVPTDARAAVGVDSFESLGGAAIKRLAIGQPRTVPAGQYAEQVLMKLGVMGSLRDRIVYGGSVRQVLDYVERGEVDAGIVYASDAKESGEKVRVVARADESSHEPIVYSVAAVRASRNRGDTDAFIAYLKGDAARAVLALRGFTAPAPATRPSDAEANAPRERGG
jgi:molybdate transport system substrate-binding protein